MNFIIPRIYMKYVSTSILFDWQLQLDASSMNVAVCVSVKWEIRIDAGWTTQIAQLRIRNIKFIFGNQIT